MSSTTSSTASTISQAYSPATSNTTTTSTTSKLNAKATPFKPGAKYHHTTTSHTTSSSTTSKPLNAKADKFKPGAAQHFTTVLNPATPAFTPSGEARRKAMTEAWGPMPGEKARRWKEIQQGDPKFLRDWRAENARAKEEAKKPRVWRRLS
jgi:hypothetical protein